MWCPEISGDFPRLCSRRLCLVWVLFCIWSWGKGTLCFYIFGWFKAWCNMPNNSRMYFDHYFWALGQCPNIIHSGPNLLGNYKAYISSVFKRYRFCSSTVILGQWNLCLFHNEIIKHLAHILRALFLKGHIMYIQ